MRKSIKIAPGVKLNVSKSGVGASVGGRGGRYSVHSSGRRTVSAGGGLVPGVYYQKSSGGSRKGAKQVQEAPPAAHAKKPGLFAPKGEKELYKAVKAHDVHAMKLVGDQHPDFRLPSYSLAGLMMLTSDSDQSEQLLKEAFATGKDPATDKFVSTYLFTRLELSIAQGVTAELPVNRDAVGLALAELKQERGDVAGAIDVVEQLEPTTYSAVSLAELYAQAGRWDDVIELTEGIKNEDDAAALLCVFRGQAFRAGLPRRRTRSTQGSPAITLPRRADPAPSAPRKSSERPRPRQEGDGAQRPRTHTRRGFHLPRSSRAARRAVLTPSG
jgi:hypothetical protein